jgi:hypothetical protein
MKSKLPSLFLCEGLASQDTGSVNRYLHHSHLFLVHVDKLKIINKILNIIRQFSSCYIMLTEIQAR